MTKLSHLFLSSKYNLKNKNHILLVFLPFFLLLPFNLLNAQWKTTNGLVGDSVLCFATAPPTGEKGIINLFAGTKNKGIFLSTDNGTNWLQVNNGLTNLTIFTLAVSGSNIFAGSYGGGVFLSTNNGTSWIPVDSGLENHFIQSLAILPDTNVIDSPIIFAGARGEIFQSTNYGASWTLIRRPMPVFSIMSGIIGAYSSGTDSSLLFEETITVFDSLTYDIDFSTDYGKSWSSSSLEGNTLEFGNTFINSFAFYPSNKKAGISYIYACGANKRNGGGVFLFDNKNKLWSNIGLKSINVNYLAVTSNETGGINLFAATDSEGIFLSKNNGTNWYQVNLGLPNIFISSLVVDTVTEGRPYLFAGTYGQGVWKRSISEMITGVNVNKNKLPTGYSLQQNYPNPFNPTTTIEYELPKISKVELTIYDMLGNIVKTFKYSSQQAGKQSVVWNGRNSNGQQVASGVYIYTLKAVAQEGKPVTFVKSAKLVLLK